MKQRMRTVSVFNNKINQSLAIFFETRDITPKKMNLMVKLDQFVVVIFFYSNYASSVRVYLINRQ